MDLILIKEAYKSETENQQVVKNLPIEDLSQMFDEIDNADTLQEFLDVVSLWSSESVYIGSAMVVLKRIVELHQQ